MSDTPRVDAAAKAGSDLGQANEAWSGIWPLARQLERENAALREQLAGRTEQLEVSIQNNALIKNGLIKRAERAEAQLAERDAEIARLKAERDTSVAVTERIKVALRIRGTGSYVEWAAYCRDALEKLERAEAELAKLRQAIELAARAMGGEGVNDQGEAWDKCLRILDAARADSPEGKK